MMKKSLLVLVALIISHSSLIAQNASDTYVVSGTIVERESQAPLEYATIAFFSSTENKTPDIGEMRMDIHHQQPQIDFFQRMVDKYHNNPLTLDDYLIENFVK